MQQSHQKSLKKEFLKKWIMGLQICSSSKEKMSLLERKKAIKLSADLAMASTSPRITKRSWSRALIAKASSDRETGTLAKQILAHKHDSHYNCYLNATPTTTYTNHYYYCYKSTRMMIYGRKSCNNNKKSVTWKKCNNNNNNNNNNNKVKARSMAKRLVKKRTQILKGLIPGGEYLDEYSLVKETLDYVVSLRAQVDVMNYLANFSSTFFS